MTTRHHVVCLLACASFAWSQSSYTASVRGVVTDRSGAAVVGAKIAVTETERNVPHTVVTDDAGRFAVTALPPGKYSFTVESPGFKKYAETGIPLAVQQQATLNAVLEVGE